MTRESHLVCFGCGSNPTVAMFDGSEVIVCHCTGVDGEIEPVVLHGFDALPGRWEFVAHGEGPSGATAELEAEG